MLKLIFVAEDVNNLLGWYETAQTGINLPREKITILNVDYTIANTIRIFRYVHVGSLPLAKHYLLSSWVFTISVVPLLNCLRLTVSKNLYCSLENKSKLI